MSLPTPIQQWLCEHRLLNVGGLSLILKEQKYLGVFTYPVATLWKEIIGGILKAKITLYSEWTPQLKENNFFCIQQCIVLYNVQYNKLPPFTQIICLPFLSPLNHKHFSSSWLLPSSPVKSFVCHESHLSPIKSFGHHDCQRLPKKVVVCHGWHLSPMKTLFTMIVIAHQNKCCLECLRWL